MLIWIKEKIEFKYIPFSLGTRPAWLLCPFFVFLFLLWRGLFKCKSDGVSLSTKIWNLHKNINRNLWHMMGPGFSLFLPFIWLKTNGTNWTWHCYFCSKWRKIYNFTIFLCFDLGMVAFVYGKRQERKMHYFNFTW